VFLRKVFKKDKLKSRVDEKKYYFFPALVFTIVLYAAYGYGEDLTLPTGGRVSIELISSEAAYQGRNLLIVAVNHRMGVEAAADALRQPQQLAGDKIVVNKKVRGLLFHQIKLRKKQISEPRADRLKQMKGSGMRVKKLDIQRIYIYLVKELIPIQVKELQALGINLYLDSWIPPVGNHPAGFLLADMPIDTLDELASKTYVVRLDTAEQVAQPQTMPGYEESIPVNK